MALAIAPVSATQTRVGLPPLTDATRAIANRARDRRLALLSDQQLLRARYEEVMRWVNPPWDGVALRVDPRNGGSATAERLGENILHADLVNAAVDRWAVLELGEAPVFRWKPRYVPAPVDDRNDPQRSAADRQQYEYDSAIAQLQSTSMENQTNEWAENADLHRTLLWAAWAKRAFGKAIIKSGWDPDLKAPTAELYENPSAVYYGWTKRYGRRRLAWAMVSDEMDVSEANRRFGLNLPIDSTGALAYGVWVNGTDSGDMDQRPEQASQNMQYVVAAEYWELGKQEDQVGVWYSLILADRVVDGPTFYPWKRLPFHVLENQHIPTWSHGKSTAEVVIPLNAALDDTLDREHQVIQFEAGPRFKGLNMDVNSDEVDIPPPFHMVPLRPGEDIAQIQVGVDFFPSDTHLRSIYEAIHRSTGLTPIAWGMSPNAQTSGRAMSAEWRAVELPLTGALINAGPPIKEIVQSWWDYAEAYDSAVRELSKGYRRVEIVWQPLDIRDATEKTADIINRLNANLIDPETAIQESGYENVDEIMAKIKAFLTDPIWNPLRYQQLLTLQQLELSIRQQQLQVAAMEQQAAGAGAGAGASPGAGAPPPDQLAQQGATAAAQQGQVAAPGGAGQEANNQPGGAPLPLTSSILSQTPLENGIGNRIMVNPAGGGAAAPPQGPSPTAGVVGR